MTTMHVERLGWWSLLSRHWDTQSGYRERLVLLAWFVGHRASGPEMVRSLDHTKYDPHRNEWRGFDHTGQHVRLTADAEPNVTLERLRNLGVDYNTACAAVGAEP